MKVVDFPNKGNEDKQDIQDFLDQVKVSADENDTTQAIVVMMDDDGNIGVSGCGSYFDLIGMMAIAMKDL